MKKIAYVLALLAPISAGAAETGRLVRFVSCPVYRDADSGKKSGCWLADRRESGENVARDVQVILSDVRNRGDAADW